ncbi:MAG TPA: hypothetical protein VKT21_06395 [Thermoplasmata archaeon]|nr:hypothetical protein [Thermoplasmata archaeon]
MAVIAGALVFRIGVWGLSLEGLAIIGVAAGGVGAAMFFAIGYDTRPIRLEISPSALVFYRPGGKQVSLKLSKGTKVRLLDQSIYLSKPRFLLNHTPYFMSHSATTELISLTREAFVAIQEDLVVRGAVLERKGPIPMTPDSVAWEYRL